MIVFRSNKFARKFKRLPINIQERFEQRMSLFMEDVFDPVLRLHKLHGEYASCISINITSDVRLIIETVSPNVYKLRDIGTHSELYE